MKRVALLAPMRSELRPLVRPLALRRRGDGLLFTGRLASVEVVAAISGIGTRRAAVAAGRLLDAGAVDHLVVVGVAGGICRSVARLAHLASRPQLRLERL